MYLAQQFTFGHVMGWTKPEIFLNDNNTLAFTRQLVQLKANNSAYLVFGRLMHPPEISSATAGPLPKLRWCSNTCCDTPVVIGQVWKASDGSLGLAIANPSGIAVSAIAKLRVDGHTLLEEGGETMVDGVLAVVGATHLTIPKYLPPLSAALIRISKWEPTKNSK